MRAYRIIYRFLETDDEYFNYGGSEIPDQGRWHIHGLYLPEAVLKQIYSDNAQRVLLSDCARRSLSRRFSTSMSVFSDSSMLMPTGL